MPTIVAPSPTRAVIVQLPVDGDGTNQHLAATIVRAKAGGVVDLVIVGGHRVDDVPYAAKGIPGRTSWAYPETVTEKLTVGDDGLIAADAPAAKA